jgi:hypothetical protein
MSDRVESVYVRNMLDANVWVLLALVVAGCTVEDHGGGAVVPFEEVLVPGESVHLATAADDPLGEAADVVGWNGRLAVVDRLGKNVKVFTFDGELVMTIGRLGDGPGEFREPISLAVDDRGQLAVLDLLHARVTYFSPAGERTSSFAFQGAFTGGMEALDRGRALLIGTRLLTDQGEAATPYMLHVFDHHGNVLMSLGRQPEPRARAEGPFMGVKVGLVDDSVAVWGIAGRRSLFFRPVDEGGRGTASADSIALGGLPEPDFDSAPQELDPLFDWAVQHPLLMEITGDRGVALVRFIGGDARKGEQWYQYAVVSLADRKTVAVTERTSHFVQRMSNGIATGVTVEDDGEAYLRRYRVLAIKGN